MHLNLQEAHRATSMMRRRALAVSLSFVKGRRGFGGRSVRYRSARKFRRGTGLGFDAVAGHDAVVGFHPTAVARGRGIIGTERDFGEGRFVVRRAPQMCEFGLGERGLLSYLGGRRALVLRGLILLCCFLMLPRRKKKAP